MSYSVKIESTDMFGRHSEIELENDIRALLDYFGDDAKAFFANRKKAADAIRRFMQNNQPDNKE